MPRINLDGDPRRYWLWLMATLAAYFLTGIAGVSLYVAEVRATLIWAPTGISIAALYLLGYRFWPGVFLGALSVNLCLNSGLLPALTVAVGNTLEAVIAVWLVKRWSNHATPFEHVRDVLGYILLACFGATMISALVGAAVTTGIDAPEHSDFHSVWRLWWLGDMMGALLVAPVLILLLHPQEPFRSDLRPLPARLAEGSFTLFAGVAMVVLVYADILDPNYSTRLTYLPLVPMLWAALRFSRLTTVLQNLVVCCAAIALTLSGTEGAGKDQANLSLMLLFLFLTVQNSALLLVTAVVRDRNRTDAALAEARKAAEEASAQKSRFLTNMSHEIRTPLNGILGVTALMLPDIHNDKQRSQLRIIQSSADSLLNILNDVLDHGRIESGKLVIEPRTFPLPQLIRDITGLFESQAEARSLSLKTHVANDVPEFVTGDDTRIRQILVNLLSNAVKFTRQGSITLNVEMTTETPDPVIRFVVRDTGIGIPSKALKNIFDAFTQADSSTARIYGGSGLGLTISKQLAERLGGTLELVSLEGVGTEVIVTLPLPRASDDEVRRYRRDGEQPSGETGQRTALLLGKRILVAEDNAINAQVTRQMLEKLGYDVAVAEDGEKAMAQWQQGFDLILMDCHMPRMDGYQTTREIRKLERDDGRHIPIVALTANAMRDERERCITAGMDDYLSKPIRLEQLDRTLRRHLAPRR